MWVLAGVGSEEGEGWIEEGRETLRQVRLETKSRKSDICQDTAENS